MRHEPSPRDAGAGCTNPVVCLFASAWLGVTLLLRSAQLRLDAVRCGTPWWLALCVTLCIGDCGTVRARAQTPALWTWSADEPIEWVQPVGTEHAALLLSTQSGRLHLLDARTGRALLPAAVVAQAGVRAATLPDYCGTPPA
ncbi:MAG: hypothetical protein KKB50_09590, partial [Planctomycetes bacterium]|nr:hypothetical protein [Planctomycetota bacterium]